MSRFMMQCASSFVALLRESDIRTQENGGARRFMALEFRSAARIEKDTNAFAKQFSAAVLADIRAQVRNAQERERLAVVAKVRVSEAKRIFLAWRKGNVGARKVYAGTLSVIAFLQSLSKGNGKRKALTSAAFTKLVQKALKRVSRKERAQALAALAGVVRKQRA